MKDENGMREAKAQVDFHGRAAEALTNAKSSDWKHENRSPTFRPLFKTPGQKDIWEALTDRSERATASRTSNKTIFKTEIESLEALGKSPIFTLDGPEAMTSLQYKTVDTYIRFNNMPSIKFVNLSNRPPPTTISGPDLSSPPKEPQHERIKPEHNKSVVSMGSKPSDILHLTSAQRDLNLIFPYLIQERLASSSVQCIASYVDPKRSMVRCTANSKERIEEHQVSAFLQDLGENSITQRRILKLLGSNYYYCSRHAKSSKKAIADLGSKMSKKSTKAKEIKAGIAGWIQVLSGAESAALVLGSIEINPDIKTEIKTEIESDITSDVKPRARQAKKGLTPWQPKWTQNLSVAEALEKKIKMPLTSRDQQTNTTGYIYIFWKEGRFGEVKIGQTKNLEQRLKAWQKCDPTHTYHKTTSDEGEPIKIPHVHRVEALIHIELKEFRRKQKCSTCTGVSEHDEWFEVDVEHAKRVLQKWQTWILQEPYAPDENSEWRINPEMEDTIQEICQPVPIPEKVSPKKMRPKRPVSPRKVSPKKALPLLRSMRIAAMAERRS